MVADGRGQDAWLDAALADEFGGAPDVAARVLAAADEAGRGAAAGAAPARGSRTFAVVAVLAGAAAVLATWLWRDDGTPRETATPAAAPESAGEQDPQRPPRPRQANSHDELRSLAKTATSVRLTWQCRVTEHTVGLGSGIEVSSRGWFVVPELATTLELVGLALGESAGEPCAPALAVVCDLQLEGGATLHGFLGLDDASSPIVFGTPSLGPHPLVVDSDDATALAEAVRGLERRAAETFALVRSGAELDAVPRTVEILVCEAVAEAGLQTLRDLRGLRHVTIAATSLREAEVPLLRDVPVIADLFRRRDVAVVAIGEAALRPLLRCEALETLTLVGAEVGDEFVAALAALPRLQELRIEGAAATLTGRGFAAFAAGAARLRDLRLLACPGLDDAGLAAIAGAVRADTVHVALAPAPKVTAAGTHTFLTAVTARDLTLENVVLAGALQLGKDAPLQRSLASLRLVASTVHLEGIAGFRALRELRLERCSLPAKGLRPAGLTRLTTLEIHGGAFPGEDLLAAVQLPSLRAVALRDLGERMPWPELCDALAQNRALAEIDLRGNSLPAGVVERLRERLPGAIVVADPAAAIHDVLDRTRGR